MDQPMEDSGGHALAPEMNASGAAPAGWRRLLRAVVLYLFVPYVAVTAFLAVFQRSMIYRPLRSGPLVATEWGLSSDRCTPVRVATSDGLELCGWRLASDASTGLAVGPEGGRPLLIYFPGNAGHRGYRATLCRYLAEIGLDVLIVDYRGYAENDGSPSEEGLARDAQAVWNFATGRLEVEPRRIVLYGRSLGGAVATRLAADLCRSGSPPLALVVHSTFSSMADAAEYLYPWLPVRLLLLDQYASDRHIADVTCPVLVIHGTDDPLVPIELGRRLAAAAPPRSAGGIPKRMLEIPDLGHNGLDLASFRPALEDLLRQCRGIP